MEDRQKDIPLWEDLQAELSAFRYFDLDGRREQGDRFLQPWLYCHVFAMGSRSKGERKRASKELKSFFQKGSLHKLLKKAGDQAPDLLEAHLFDSAAKYLLICREDDGFGRKLFGLVRMKQEEKEDKIISDVYRAMIPLLASLTDMEEGPVMMRALDQACRNLYPQRLADMRLLVETAKDELLREVLPAFEGLDQADHESVSAP